MSIMKTISGKKVLLLAILASCLSVLVAGSNERQLLQGATNSRSDRITQAMDAAQGSILRAVSQGARPAATWAAVRQGLNVAKMTTKVAADSWEFGDKRRHLLQGATNSRSDRITQALDAAHGFITRAVAEGARPDATWAASRQGLTAAKMTTKVAADSWEFGGRKLLRCNTCA